MNYAKQLSQVLCYSTAPEIYHIYDKYDTNKKELCSSSELRDNYKTRKRLMQMKFK